MDKLTPEQRSLNMSKIHSKNTKPEVFLRKALFKAGFRFRKNDKRYIGTPDILLPHYNAVIFINGCFWHGHENCRLFRLPKTNIEFWKNKIEKNKKRDVKNHKNLYGKLLARCSCLGMFNNREKPRAKTFKSNSGTFALARRRTRRKLQGILKFFRNTKIQQNLPEQNYNLYQAQFQKAQIFQSQLFLNLFQEIFLQNHTGIQFPVGNTPKHHKL